MEMEIAAEPKSTWSRIVEDVSISISISLILSTASCVEEKKFSQPLPLPTWWHTWARLVYT